MATSGAIPILPPGFVSIYGSASIYGFGYDTKTLLFGRIYQMASTNSGNFSVGQNVLFPFKNQYSVSYQNTTYYLVEESNILLTEQESDEDIS